MGCLLKMQILVGILQIYWNRIFGDKVTTVFLSSSDSFIHKHLKNTA